MSQTPASDKIEAAKMAIFKHNLRYDTEWLRIATQAGGGDAEVPTQWNNVLELRAFTENILGTIFRMAPSPKQVEETKTSFDSPDGTHQFTVSRFATAKQRAPPKEGEPLRPAVLVSEAVEIAASGLTSDPEQTVEGTHP